MQLQVGRLSVVCVSAIFGCFLWSVGVRNELRVNTLLVGGLLRNA